MIKAGALLFSLGFMIFSGALISALMLYDQYTWMEYTKNDLKNSLSNEVDHAVINYPYKLENAFDSLIIKRNDVKVIVKNVNWGILKLISFTGSKGIHFDKRVVWPNLNFLPEPIFTVTECKRDIVLSRGAEINGDVDLNGNLFICDEQNKGSCFSYSYRDSDELIFPEYKIDTSDVTIYSSFDQAVNFADTNAPVILISEDPVIVSKSLSDYFFVAAPSVIIDSGFVGKLQVYAKDSVIVRSGARLEYPTVLSLMKTDNSHPEILIKDSVYFGGIICSEAPGSFITIEEKASVYGYVLTKGSLDLRGELSGKVYCKRLIYRDKETFVEDELRGGKIFPVHTDPFDPKFLFIDNL